jgi:hypothetical protein
MQDFGKHPQALRESWSGPRDEVVLFGCQLKNTVVEDRVQVRPAGPFDRIGLRRADDATRVGFDHQFRADLWKITEFFGDDVRAARFSDQHAEKAVWADGVWRWVDLVIDRNFLDGFGHGFDFANVGFHFDVQACGSRLTVENLSHDRNRLENIIERLRTARPNGDARLFEFRGQLAELGCEHQIGFERQDRLNVWVVQVANLRQLEDLRWEIAVSIAANHARARSERVDGFGVRRQESDDAFGFSFDDDVAIQIVFDRQRVRGGEGWNDEREAREQNEKNFFQVNSSCQNVRLEVCAARAMMRDEAMTKSPPEISSEVEIALRESIHEFRAPFSERYHPIG